MEGSYASFVSFLKCSIYGVHAWHFHAHPPCWSPKTFHREHTLTQALCSIRTRKFSTHQYSHSHIIVVFFNFTSQIGYSWSETEQMSIYPAHRLFVVWCHISSPNLRKISSSDLWNMSIDINMFRVAVFVHFPEIDLVMFWKSIVCLLHHWQVPCHLDVYTHLLNCTQINICSSRQTSSELIEEKWVGDSVKFWSL